MSSDKLNLAAERAMFLTKLEQALTADNLVCKHTISADGRIDLSVSRAEWTGAMMISDRSGKNVVTYSRWFRGALDESTIARLRSSVRADYDQWKHRRDTAALNEATAKRYLDQKERELSGVRIPKCLDVSIRATGELAGRYYAKINAGSVLERLSAEQVDRLAKLLDEFELEEKA